MPVSNTIADIVVNNSGGAGLGAFDILLAALGAADPTSTGLLAAASDPAQNLTVFAPTDDAFIALAQVIDPSVASEADAVSTLVAASAALSPADDPAAFLRTVLSYHISAGEKSSAKVSASGQVATLAGLSLTPDGMSLGDEEPGLPDPEFVGGLTDLQADNGVVHVIDNVLLPYDLTFADGGFLFTGGGNDAVIGSARNDFVFLGSGDDVANGGDGADIIFGNRGNDTINGGDGNDKLLGNSGHDIVNGGAGNDWVSGGAGNDVLEGGAGRDYLYGSYGADRIEGGWSWDFLHGGWGHDELFGQAGKDHLVGGRGNDLVHGGIGDDHLNGGSGHDRLVGGSGDDYLIGSWGADQFVFNPNNIGASGSMDEGHDVIADFNIAQGDRLVLDLSTFEKATLDTVAAAAGDTTELELIDLLADLDPTTAAIESVITLGASSDGDLLIGHPAGDIELNGISASVNPAVLIPVVDFEFA